MSGPASDRVAIKAIIEMSRRGSWAVAVTVQELQSRCRVSRLRAYRLAHGWTLNEVATRIKELAVAHGKTAPRLTHDRISRWENGDERPSFQYLDLLCQLYHARPDLLGYGVDYASNEDVPTSTEAAFLNQDANDANAENRSRMERREAIRGLLSAAGFGLSAPALNALDRTRQLMAETLERRNVGDSTVDWWEQRATQHGSSYRVRSAGQLIGDAVLDFDDLQQLLDQRQGLEVRRRLTSVAAQLAGLIGVLCVDLGEPGQANRWFHTGQLAAEDVGDRALRAWLRTREALVSLYYASPADAAALAQSARHLAGNIKCVAAAMAPAVQARALARLGREREATVAIQHAARVFEILPDTSNAGVFGFGEQKLRFYEGNVLARAGMTRDALQAQSRALRLYSASDLVDRGHVYLDRAVCLLRAGHLEEACQSTSRTLLDLPLQAGIGAVLAEAQEVRAAIPLRYHTDKNMKDLEEVIRVRCADLVNRQPSL
ncbi:helix-turn-helix transcriptional regulator [Actinoplanes sp. NEAU-A11]|uniref:Helix-turn-helix transcriptional regulator n=2 Tax=Actinoplanes aureus TaxID=2792083 RepID=A0A931CC47_9ACTN|nr:helix-turn-helix transcriptional regulator [Actinoplanes aureus]